MPEEDTAAAGMPGQVEEKEKRRRLDELMRLQAEVSLKRNQARVGEETRVLVCSREGGKYCCRSAWEAPDADGWIIVPGEGRQVGQTARVRITGADTYDLAGRFLDESAE